MTLKKRGGPLTCESLVKGKVYPEHATDDSDDNHATMDSGSDMFLE